MSDKKYQKQIGVLWINEFEKDGEKKKMLSGPIDLGINGEVNIAIFPNEQKKDEKHPDYRVVLGTDKTNGKGKVKPF